jgi:hypothetical protein
VKETFKFGEFKTPKSNKTKGTVYSEKEIEEQYSEIIDE